MLVDDSDHADNRHLDRPVHVYVGVRPWQIASGGVQIQQEQQSEQQQEQQQVRLAQHSLVMSDRKGET